MRKEIRIHEIVKSMGARSMIALTLVFLLTVAATCLGGLQLYRVTKEGIHLQGKLNVARSAKEFNNYLLLRENTVLQAAHVVDQMNREGQPNKEILKYMTAETRKIQRTMDKDSTGLYGWINEEYCDGDGWVPDADYIPTKRPWYTQTMSENNEVTFVRPYLDSQTGIVLTTMARTLEDDVSVIAFDVSLEPIQNITRKITKDSPGSYGIVLDRAGTVIAHTDEEELGNNYLRENDTLGAELADTLLRTSSKEFELSFEGQKYRVFTERIEGGWRTISMIDTRASYRPLKIILMLLGIFTLLEVIVFIVISRNQIAKNEALASAEAAHRANRAKSQFLSRMSHEIRTPINAIIGLDSIALRDESISPTTREELNKIGSSARHLLSLVNDILDMSRIESGKLPLKEEVFSFRDLLEEIRIIIGGQCQDKGLNFICDAADSMDEYYKGDALKLKQVIINILGNSVKFTDAPGDITFTAEQTDTAGDRAVLRFKMADNGIGMDAEYLPTLFDAFSQEDAGNTSRYGGSGLGLAITKSFVDMMDGEIGVESEKGVGTTFTVTVRLGRVSEEELPGTVTGENAEEDGLPEGLHLLIVEDQELNAEVLTDLLELEDISSEWAQNGQLAIEAFKEKEAGHFDAILMDIRMPVMDGLTATRGIRSLDRPDAATIPIIALSANAFEEDVKECLDAGMNMHLSKPVDVDRLKEALRELLG